MINSELTIETVIAFVTGSIYFDSCALSGQKEGISRVWNNKDSKNNRKKIAEALILCSIRTEVTDNEGDS